MKNTYLLTDDSGDVIGVTQTLTEPTIHLMLIEHFMLTKVEFTQSTKEAILNGDISKVLLFEGTDENEYVNSDVFSITKVAFY